ncbi:MAG: hypothetical protein HKN84_02340 [Gammaproteobacteria bacterium]|nr:hypothetical protein [Gammaproteobacteria bacterium]
MRSSIIIPIAAGALAALPAIGHHSEAGYDSESVAAFEGTVTHYGWRNPHVYITVEATAESGETVEWLVETGATPIMARSGWTPQSLAPGDVVSVRGHPDKRAGKYGVILLSLTKEDGTVLAQVHGATEPPDAVATSLAGVWRGVPASIGSFGRALNSTPLTAAGEAARASYDYMADMRAAECIAPQSPRIITSNVLYLSEIEIGDDIVFIRSEYLDAVRAVYMDGRGHPEDVEPTPQGHSIGRWEDGALVVDTVAFAEQQSVNGQGVPSSPQKHTIERYALSDDGRRLTIDVFLEDPVYLAEPFSGTLEWQYSPTLSFHSYNCDPEISSIFLQ